MVEVVHTWPGGRHFVMGPTTVNTNTTEITVPTGKIWKIKYVYATYRASATTGTRYFQVRFLSGTSLKFPPTNQTLAASERKSYYAQTGGYSANTARIGIDGSANDGLVNDIIPDDFMLYPTEKIKIYDTANVDPNGDSIVYLIGVCEYPYA